jgi:drug/metabolite transporter (DMT)-like permease
MPESFFYVLSCVILFGSASVIFSEYSRRTSSIWMNAFKGFIAFFCFLLAALIPSTWNVLPTLSIVGVLLLSGLIGLNIGDSFLLEAYRKIGAARTLMIFSFQPIVIGIGAYLFFGEALNLQILYAMGMLILCVLVVSFERHKEAGRWEWSGPFIALTGMLFDASGVLLTRYSFESTPGLSSGLANLIRCTGAVVGFIILLQLKPLHLRKRFGQFSVKDKRILLMACVAGTFLSLWLYLRAIDIGPLGPVSAIAGCVPIFSAIFECLYYKKWPSAYLLVGLGFFSVGLWMLAGL